MSTQVSSNLLVIQPQENGEKVQSAISPSKKGPKVWLLFASMCICLFLSALEFSSVATALPTIADALHTSQFTWVGSAYALAATAFLPMSGGLAQTFGRRLAMLIAIGVFALGSGICGAANSMTMLIAGRTIQGLGGGGIESLTTVILSDLVTLKERGIYIGLFALTWCLAASIGPVVGGSLATQGQWRWLFYLNLPLTFTAFILVMFLWDLPVPSGSYQHKLMRMDWIGNLLVISSTVACTIALTRGGIIAPWYSATVFFPLTIGFFGLASFFVYEVILAEHPLVPLSVITNITSISGYIQTFCGYVVTSAFVYYFPVYFQACKRASPVLSGVYSLSVTALGPAAIVTGISIKVTGRYRPQIWLAWSIIIIAFGLMSTLHTEDPLGKSLGYQALLGCGLGTLHATSMFPIQAALPVTQNATSLTLMSFLRAFAVVWGVVIGSTVLQNELTMKLPESFIQTVPQGTAIVYALIPQLPRLLPETRYEVEAAFAGSLAVLWRVLAAVGGAGLLSSLFMRGLPLQNILDADWTPKDDVAG